MENETNTANPEEQVAEVSHENGGELNQALSIDMSKEELLEAASKALKKANDQELGRKKYQKQVKDLKALLNGDAETTEETPKEEVKPNVPVNSSREEIRLIGEGYTDSEIDEIKSYAQAYNLSLADASKDDLLQARIQRAREERNTAMASLGSPRGSTVASSDKDFYNSALSGDVDLNNPANAKRFAKIAATKATR